MTTARPRPPGCGRSRSNPDDVWARPRGGPRPRDAGPGRRRHPLPRGPRGRLGQRATCSRCTTGGTSRCSCWRRRDPSGAGHLRRRGAQREVGRRSARDARCQRAALATAARRPDTGDRFGALADAWAPRPMPASWYVFNDLHGVMALVGAGGSPTPSATSRHSPAMSTATASARTSGWHRRSAFRRAAPCFGSVRAATTRSISELLPIRRTFQVFGGSHAQRDALRAHVARVGAAGRTARSRASSDRGAVESSAVECVRLDATSATAASPGRCDGDRRRSACEVSIVCTFAVITGRTVGLTDRWRDPAATPNHARWLR